MSSHPAFPVYGLLQVFATCADYSFPLTGLLMSLMSEDLHKTLFMIDLEELKE